jgi:hypothetical protein
MYDSLGRLILEEEILDNHTIENNLQHGVYILNIKTDNNILTSKIVLK